MFSSHKLLRIAKTPLALLVAAVGLPATAVNADAGGNQQCAPQTISATLSPTNPTVYHIFGQLCWKGQLSGKTMQVLVHGLTYDHRYWDWPQSPQTYSYTRTATAAGYATLAIDRIGDGASSHPADGASITAQSNAYVLHQIVQKLKAGTIGGTAFPRIVAVGHSYGSVTSAYEAATYHDVSAVILSGFLHDSTPDALTAITNDFYPANLDPKFAHSGLNDTYLTTRPGTRTPLFFNTANADPSVIALDEQLKQTATTGELDPTGFAQVNASTPQINVPVLLAVGDSDFLFCDPSTAGLSCANSSAILARESSHYSAQACLKAFVQPNSGHDINLHRNAHLWFDAATNWANQYIGRDAGHPAARHC